MKVSISMEAAMDDNIWDRERFKTPPPNPDSEDNLELATKKPKGSKSGAKIIGQQCFVRGGERVNDPQVVDDQPVVHVFGN